MEATGETTTTSDSGSDQRIRGYREQIIRAAEVEFGRTGFAATRVTAIAATAGLSLATVYKSFAGKAEIWDALHRTRMDALLESVREAGRTADSGGGHHRDSGRPGLEHLLAGLRQVFLFLSAHPAYLEMNLRTGGGWASSVDDAHGTQRTVWSSGVEVITAGMQGAASRGELGGLDPRIAAGMAISALQVWLSEWVAAGRAGDPEVLADEMAGRLRLLLAG